MQNRTDLALELKEEKNIGSAQSGIIVKTRIDTTNHIKETKIIIKNKKGEDSLGKPKGTYITIEAKDLSTNDGSFHKEMSEALFLNLKEMLNKKKKILIAGLGNADVTADSLGPKVVNNLYITRHLQKEGIGNYQFELSAIAPGVMAQTGIETSEILESLADRIKPDVVIVIDALAARLSAVRCLKFVECLNNPPSPPVARTVSGASIVSKLPSASLYTIPLHSPSFSMISIIVQFSMIVILSRFFASSYKWLVISFPVRSS